MGKPLLFAPVVIIFSALTVILSCTDPAASGSVAPKFEPIADPGHNAVYFVPEEKLQIAEYVVDLFEDSKGNIWLGTMARGAVRYNGETLKYFTTDDGLAENTVVDIAEDHAGNLWFGTHKGASKFDGKNFVYYGLKEGLHGAGCNLLFDRKGQLWAATNDGVFRFDGTNFVGFDLPKPELESISYKWVPGKVWSLHEDRQGNIWFGVDGYGAYKYNGKSFEHITTTDGLSSNNVTRIIEDEAGRIWFGSVSSDHPKYLAHGGLTMYNGSNYTRFDGLDGLFNSDIYTIYEDKNGCVWIGAIGVGAYRYCNGKFELFNVTDEPQLIERFAIQSMLHDSKGNLWFGFSGGLFRLEGDTIVNITAANIQP